MPLSVCVRPANEYMVGDAVPRVVNADEKQQQRPHRPPKYLSKIVGLSRIDCDGSEPGEARGY